jgi:hypothetical protein
MRKYQVVGKSTCHTCKAERALDDPTIEAKDRRMAAMVFRHKHWLCPNCLQDGIRSLVVFDHAMNVRILPQFRHTGVKLGVESGLKDDPGKGFLLSSSEAPPCR